MLTKAEKQACRTVKRTDWRQLSYGTLEDGFCPIGAVARMRGITFYWHDDSRQFTSIPWECCLERGPAARPFTRDEIANYERFQAIKGEVLAWAGFADEGLFVKAFAVHGTSIFPPEPLEYSRDTKD